MFRPKGATVVLLVVGLSVIAALVHAREAVQHNEDSKLNPVTLKGHTGWVWSVAFSPDGKTLASASADGTVKLWNLEKRQETASLTPHTGSHWFRGVAFSPDGRQIALANSDHTIKLADPETGMVRATLVGHRSDVWSVAFSPDGRTPGVSESGSNRQAMGRRHGQAEGDP